MLILFTGQLDDRTVDVASGATKWLNKFLPVGDTNNGNILKCNVTVEDEHGGSAMYVLEEVQVR